MPQFQTNRKIAHKPDDMFALVANVEAYPQFVPLCQSLRVKTRRTLEDGRELIVADMTVGYKAIRETFTSRVTLDRAGRQILVEYVDGPFSALQNRWTFTDAGSPDRPATEVGFFISYEFKSRTFAMLMGSMFDTAFRKFSAAFEARADVVYGRA